METEQTRQVIRDFYSALATKDDAKLGSLLADDIEWQMPASIPDGVLRGRERVSQELGSGTVKRLFQRGTFRLEIYHIWADGNIGIAQTGTHAVTKAGADYDMEYVWVYTCDDGRITHIREYLDTRLAAKALGWD